MKYYRNDKLINCYQTVIYIFFNIYAYFFLKCYISWNNILNTMNARKHVK